VLSHQDIIDTAICLCNEMSSFNCGKFVDFDKTVKVYCYRQTVIEPNVCWEQEARDRERFKRRTMEVEQGIAWVLTKQHREDIFKTRY